MFAKVAKAIEKHYTITIFQNRSVVSMNCSSDCLIFLSDLGFDVRDLTMRSGMQSTPLNVSNAPVT